MKQLVACLFASLITGLALAQELTLKEILEFASKANAAATDSLKTCSYEFTEKAIALKLKSDSSIDEADTIISRIKANNGQEISRAVIYTNSKDAKDKSGENDKKDDKKHNESFGIDIKLAEDNPDYGFALISTDDSEYVVSITPRKQKPDEGQIKGLYVFDRETYLIKTMDFEVPRPEKLHSMKMKLDFMKLSNGSLVIKNMKMEGRVKALLGIVDIRFRIAGEYYDYQLDSLATKSIPVSPK